MNYLAHLILSGDDADTMLGNFIGDFVKGNTYTRFKPRMQMGILLHRQIDSYTDNHPIVKESRALLRPIYGHYSGIVVDMFYDHFLAANWAEFYPQQTLHKYMNRVHRILLVNYLRLPGEVKRLLPFLIKSRRIENYATLGGLARALVIMSRNTSLPADTQAAIDCLNDNYDVFRTHFYTFFPQVKAMADSIQSAERRTDN